MNIVLKFIKYFFILSLFALLQACGSGDGGKVSKGHRDSIRYECKDSSDIKACGLEVRENFIEENNEFVTFEDLTKEQVRKIQLECVRSKKFGLETYNNCLDQYRTAALDGTLFTTTVAVKPKSNIEVLEASTVRIGVYLLKSKDDWEFLGGGSGVILDNDLIATNCHVTNATANNQKAVIMVKNINKDNFDSATIYKRAPEHDICLIKRDNMSEFSLKMRKIKNYKNFEKLARGDFVRTLGTPEGMEGHSAEGSIQYLGTAGKSGRNSYGDDPVIVIDDDTKIIEHNARIAGGSSGGPLFDKNGYLIGLNTFGNDAFNFSISSDHIKELLKKR